ncbi:MAG: ATPase, partial [Alphaproteobacteria bacterium]
MISDNRISGIDIIGNIPWGTHFCLFYQTKEDLIDILVPYFKAGLENNEFCLWVISEPLDEEAAKESLKVGIPDINFYLENGQIEIISHADWHVNAGALDSQMALNHLTDKIDQALTDGYEGLRYSGNVFFGDEESLDSAIGNYPMITLCTYALGICSPIDIIEIAANHQFALG